MANQPNKILVVEDEVALLKVLKLKLKSAGFNVITAWNGEDGLEMALREKPDLILLDIIMPKMDGLTMLRKIRETEYGKTVKAIVLTNLSDSSSVEKSTQAGAFDYLVKTNWQLDEVAGKVKAALNIL